MRLTASGKLQGRALLLQIEFTFPKGYLEQSNSSSHIQWRLITVTAPLAHILNNDI